MLVRFVTAAAALAAPVAGWAASTLPVWTSTSYFTRPEGAAPGAPFQGRIDFETTEMMVETDPDGAMIRNPWAWWGVFDGLQNTDPPGAVPLFDLDAQLFPGLSAEFVTTGSGALAPTDRGIIRKPVADRTPSFWELSVGPGQTWADPDDAPDGWSRASFPVSLVQSQEGQAWVGLGAFDYKDDMISDVKVAFSSVSGGGFIFWDAGFDVNAWAEVGATYTPDTVSDPAAIRAAFEQERAGLAPMKPLSALGLPDGTIESILDPKRTLTVAIYKDEVLYMDPVETPFGEYPYPRDMKVGVWSVTKSLIPGMAALRLAEKYGDDFLDSKIVDYFQEGAEFDFVSVDARARWSEVTIRHALAMMTGMGARNSGENWDFSNPNTYDWSYSYDLADQVRFYFNVGPNPDVDGPGEGFAYIDQDMWIAALAMERFLQSKEGPDATILKMLDREVYTPIGAPNFVAGTGYTDTGEPGAPYSAWGALPTVDILALAGQLIANGGVAPDGTRLLSADLIQELIDSENYTLAFWKPLFEFAGAEMRIPQMSGAGGQIVMAMPDGSALVILSRDDYNHGVSAAQIQAVMDAAYQPTVVPVPAALPLLVSGLGALALLSRRRMAG